MTTAAPTSAPRSSTGPAIAAILLISAAASLFLFWLIYIHPASATSSQYAFLPAMNAVFNGLAATALLIGYTLIRARKIKQHRASMITAFVFSTLFLVGYIAHHALHGDVRYPLHAAYHSCRRRPAPHPRHVFLLALRAHPAAPPHRALDVSHLALRFRHRRHHLRHVAPRTGKLVRALPSGRSRGLQAPETSIRIHSGFSPGVPSSKPE
jgi:hypothetical protein